MANSNISWMEWQKQVIKDEYNDLSFAKTAAEKAFTKTIAEYKKVKQK